MQVGEPTESSALVLGYNRYTMEPTVYILYFKKSDKYYIGSTNNLPRGIRQHYSGHTPSTKRLGDDFTLVFSQLVSTLKIARQAERRIKSWKRRDYVEKIVLDGSIEFLNNMGQ